MNRIQVYKYLKNRYWFWLKGNWARIEDYRRDRTRILMKKGRIFAHLFSRLPSNFTRPLNEAGIIDSNSRDVYKSMAKQNIPKSLEEIERELHKLYNPDFLPWILRLDTIPAGNPSDRDEFDRRWSMSAEDGRRMREFGHLANKYRKRRNLGSYEAVFQELGF